MVGMTTGKVGMAKMLGSETALEFTKQDATRSPTTVVLVLVGAFFARAEILGECSTVQSLPSLSLFFLKWRLARAHLFHSLGQDQSIVAQRAEMTVTDFPDKLRVSSFPDIPTLFLNSGIVSPPRLRLGQRCLHVSV